jgi:hypothetical protein
MASPLSAVASGYAQFASERAEAWGALAADVAGRIESGGYRANDIVGDLGKAAFIAGQSWFFLASETLDAVALIAVARLGLIDSDPFESPLAGASLTVSEPLTEAFGAVLPQEDVIIVPIVLASGATTFRLCVDAEGHAGGSYEGTVTASVGGASQDVPVNISIP